MQRYGFLHFVVAGLLISANITAHGVNQTHEALRDELMAMAANDQKVRRASESGDFSRWAAIDATNLARLKEIVAEYGWPTFKMVGQDGSHAAWLIAQHADRDKEFQIKVLRLMEPLVQKEQASGKHFAYLYDRTHYPQRFGTQGTCISRTEWQPFEIEDIVNVDERRRAVGLPTLAYYAKLLKDGCASPHTALHSPSATKRTVAVPELLLGQAKP